MKHALFSPSRLAYLAKCCGFTSAGTGPAAERGLEIDRCVTALLNGEPVEVPSEHAENVAWAVEAHRALAEEVGGDIETQIHVRTSLHAVAGTLDVRVVNTFDQVAVISDTKSGMGDRGNPAASPQLLSYAEGTLREFPDIERFVLAFVEVDRRRVIRAEVSADDVRAGLRILADIIKRAATDDPLTYVSGRHCSYCVRAVTCPAVVQGALVPVHAGAMKMPSPELVETLSPAEVGAFLDRYAERVELASEILSAAKARAYAILEAGGEIPGWGLAHGRRTRKWSEEAAAEEALRQAAVEAGVPVSDLYVTEFKSPAQVDKLKVLKPLVASLVTSTATKKLVRAEETKEIAA